MTPVPTDESEEQAMVAEVIACSGGHGRHSSPTPVAGGLPRPDHVDANEIAREITIDIRL
jgi:hypothetical protein